MAQQALARKPYRPISGGVGEVNIDKSKPQ
jgi:hypothetical protein